MEFSWELVKKIQMKVQKFFESALDLNWMCVRACVCVCVFNGVRGVLQITTNIYTVLSLFKSHTFNRKSWNCDYLNF